MPIYTTGTHADSWDDSELPKSLREYLAVGAEQGNRDNALFAAACQFRDAGYSETEAEKPLVARAVADGLNEAVARRKIKSTYSKPPREPASASCSAGSSGSRQHQNTATSQSSAIAMPLPPPMTDGFRIFLETVFEDGERVAIGEGRRNGNGEIAPDYGDTRLRKMWLQTGPPRNLLGVFARINPMAYRGAKNTHVTVHRHTLIEFDRDKNGQPVPKEIQYAVLSKAASQSVQSWIRVTKAFMAWSESMQLIRRSTNSESQSSTIISSNMIFLMITTKPKVNTAAYRVANVSFSIQAAIPRKSLVRSCSLSK